MGDTQLGEELPDDAHTMAHSEAVVSHMPSVWHGELGRTRGFQGPAPEHAGTRRNTWRERRAPRGADRRGRWGRRRACARSRVFPHHPASPPAGFPVNHSHPRTAPLDRLGRVCWVLQDLSWIAQEEGVMLAICWVLLGLKEREGQSSRKCSQGSFPSGLW